MAILSADSIAASPSSSHTIFAGANEPPADDAESAAFSHLDLQPEEVLRKRWRARFSPRCSMDTWAPPLQFYSGKNGPRLIVGIDTEYIPAEGGLKNTLLSYQFHASSSGGNWSGIHYPERGKRLSLSLFLSSVVELGRRAKLIDGWPVDVVLATHFGVADLCMFSNFEKLSRNTDSVRRTLLTLSRPVPARCYDSNRHGHNTPVCVRDTYLLAPNGRQSLRAVGESIGYQKIRLEDGQILDMGSLLSSNRPAYETYAIRDAEIPVRYCLAMAELNHELLGEFEIPKTLSSIGTSLLIDQWKKTGWDPHRLLGTETVQEEIFNGRYRKKVKSRQPIPKLYLREAFATESYHGGRNESFLCGPCPQNQWFDWDLCGAYPTGLATIGLPDWESIYETTNAEDFGPTTLGFARIRFSFPPDTKYPCLPVRIPAGLIFPLQGETHVAAPEIWLARRLGASIEVLDGIVIPQDTCIRPFLDFLSTATTERRKCRKGSLQELIWKEIANGTYGKLAQGLRDKRCYSSRDDAYDDLPPSRITNAFLASYVTSYVRAVLGEILAALPSSVSIASVTTDGFLTTADREVAQQASGGRLCETFRDARERITGKRECLDLKHRVDRIVSMRTRGQLTLQTSCDEKDIVLAKAGVKPPATVRTARDQNEWMISLYFDRKPLETTECVSLLPLARMIKAKADLVTVTTHKITSLDYDFKRCPVSPLEIVTSHGAHIYFETVPWRTAEEAVKCKEDWHRFSKQGRVLKSLEDYHLFQDYRSTCLPKALRRSHRGGSIKIASRQFMRALVRGKAGLSRADLTNRQIAEIITKAGVKTSKVDVDNAARPSARFIPRAVPRSKGAIELFDRLQSIFESFDAEVLLQPVSWGESGAQPSVHQCISVPPHTPSYSHEKAA